MTKEETQFLLKNIFGLEAAKDKILVDYYQRVNETAMDEFARIKAIQFKEWQDFNLEGAKWENYDGHDTWINPHTRQVKSTSELYDIFKSQSNGNK